MFNWEELGKISPTLLRTMRHITFGEYNPSYDGAYFGTKKKIYGEKEVYMHELDSEYKIFDVKERTFEEWPSEKWNYQDRFALKNLKSMKVPALKTEEAPEVSDDESSSTIEISDEELEKLLLSVKGLGKKKLKKILKKLTHAQIIALLEVEPRVLSDIKSINDKLVDNIIETWNSYKLSLQQTFID